jgi:hypothetical protein
MLETPRDIACNARIPDGPLCLSSSRERPTGADATTPMHCNTEEFWILEKLAARGAMIVENHDLHLIGEHLGGNATQTPLPVR